MTDIKRPSESCSGDDDDEDDDILGDDCQQRGFGRWLLVGVLQLVVVRRIPKGLVARKAMVGTPQRSKIARR
jgi:hypothetical protein